MNKYDFPVWTTQGGGLVRYVGAKYVFVEPPGGFPEITVGSEMHPEWDLIPANALAREADFPDGDQMEDAFANDEERKAYELHVAEHGHPDHFC